MIVPKTFLEKNSRDTTPNRYSQGVERGERGGGEEVAEGLMPFLRPLGCILGRIPETPYQSGLLQIGYYVSRVLRFRRLSILIVM